MSNVVEFKTGIVGDGAKIDADQVLSHVTGNAVTLVVIYEDRNGDLLCASTDGRAEALMLMERAKHKFIVGYED